MIVKIMVCAVLLVVLYGMMRFFETLDNHRK